MPSPVTFPNHLSGDTLPAADWDNSFALVETSFLDHGSYIVSGLTFAAGTGLSVAVAAGHAIIGADLTFASFVIPSLADNLVNHLYVLQNGTGTSNTTGTAPANSAKLGTATTAAGVVASVAMGRTTGRQQFQQPQDLVPGGLASGITSAGHPASINLANWNATAAEGKAVFGVLPTGSGQKSATLVLCAGFTPAGTGADVVELVIPYDAADGTTSITWTVRRITLRVNVAGGSPSMKIQKSSAGNATFGAGTDVGTVTFSGGDFVGSVTSALGTIASGDLMRFNVLVLGSATGWTIEVQLGNP